MTEKTDDETHAELALSPEEAALVTADVNALLPTLDPQRRERFAALGQAAENGAVPSELHGALEALLEVGLQTGRARGRYRADGEQLLTRLYGRTPAGRGLHAHLRHVNDALATLQGETVESIAVRMRTVGHFTIAIQTDATSLTLVARPDTIDVESVAVSG